MAANGNGRTMLDKALLGMITTGIVAMIATTIQLYNWKSHIDASIYTKSDAAQDHKGLVSTDDLNARLTTIRDRLTRGEEWRLQHTEKHGTNNP